MLRKISPLFLFLSLFSCGLKHTTKIKTFPSMYKEQPLSILILPPVNKTLEKDITTIYSAIVPKYLAEAGYYVNPMEITSDLLKIYYKEKLPGSPYIYKELLGVDAVLHTDIVECYTSFPGFDNAMSKVTFYFEMKSTRTGNILWKRLGYAINKVGRRSYDKFSLIDIVINSALVAAYKLVDPDYFALAEEATKLAVRTIPFGKYNSSYKKDEESEILVGGYSGNYIPMDGRTRNINLKYQYQYQKGVTFYRKNPHILK